MSENGCETARPKNVRSVRSGSNTETLWGYTVGAGVEYAATDNMILRLEASMTDLGTIDVTGDSEDTGAEYTVTQTVANFALQTGVSVKF